MSVEPAPYVFINGQPLAGAEGLSMAELLSHLNEPALEVATALNGQFIARDQRDRTWLMPGDRITVFKTIVGG